MQKLPLAGAISALLLLTGCSTVVDTASSIGDVIPRTLQRTPLFYRIDVQQGNSLEQPDISRLEPGMSKNQVQFIMGTPLLVDVFHQNRWDYYYGMRRGNGEVEQSHIALYFEDDKLIRTEGDLWPMPLDESDTRKATEIYSVPDYEEKKGIFTRMLETVGIDDN